jgi:cytochrome P450
LSDLSESFPYVDAVVREAMRYYPVAPFTNRHGFEHTHTNARCTHPALTDKHIRSC